MPEQRAPREELTRFVSAEDLTRIREGDITKRDVTFGELGRQARLVGSGRVVVATWTKPRFGNAHSLFITTPGVLGLVVRNVQHYGCKELRFCASHSDCGAIYPGDVSVEALFG